MTPTVSERKLAMELGVSRARVRALRLRGMPQDIEAAKAWRAANLDPAWAPKTGHVPKPPRTDSPIEDPTAVPNYHEAKARREAAEARIAEAKAAELEGDLVRRSVLERAQERKANAVRESLLQLPAQMAPVVAAESNVTKCQDLLMDAVLVVLGQVAA